MAVPAEREPRPREQLPKAPEGTYAWLKQYDGFEAGISAPERPFYKTILIIAKENTCAAYGGSCMEFLVDKILPGDIHAQIDGHITDRDEIVDLARVTWEISEGKLISRQEEVIEISEAMQEVRSALSALKDAKQAEDFD